MPKIKFILNTGTGSEITHKHKFFTSITESPKPAKNFIPEDYKKLSNYIDNDLRSPTVKKCMPFLDALSSGYIIPLIQDYIITLTKKGPKDEEINILGKIGERDSHPHIQLPKNYQDSSRPLGKFVNKWYIKTPPGYSCLFIHPLNQPKKDYELAAGVVDTDTYDRGIKFPYFIRKHFTEQKAQIFLKKGAPMVQVIPFKRESWTSWVGIDKKFGDSPTGFGLLIDVYKQTFWHKKKYD